MGRMIYFPLWNAQIYIFDLKSLSRASSTPEPCSTPRIRLVYKPTIAAETPVDGLMIAVETPVNGPMAAVGAPVVVEAPVDEPMGVETGGIADSIHPFSVVVGRMLPKHYRCKILMD
jgi:hypothetical protein